MVRETIRKILPKALKINIQLLKGEVNNLRNGYTFNFVKKSDTVEDYPVVLTLKPVSYTHLTLPTKA